MKIRPPMLRAICSALLVCSAAHAGMWEDGYADYQRKDYASAVAKWQIVADTGDRDAQSLLGLMHFAGQGTPQSYPNAIIWLRKAASQGEPKAQFKLGSMYANGQGFTAKPLKKATAEISENDLVVARRWAKTCIKREFQNCE